MPKINPKEENRRTFHRTYSSGASKLAKDYSFVLDDKDELKSHLRRNSLAGQTSLDQTYLDRNKKKESKNKSKNIHQDFQRVNLNQDCLLENDEWAKTSQMWSKKKYEPLNRRTFHRTYSSGASKLAKDYSFVLDDKDELKSHLRRNSLAGQISLDQTYLDRNKKKESKNKSKNIHQDFQRVNLNQDCLLENDEWAKTSQMWSKKKYEPLNYGQTSTMPEYDVDRKRCSGKAIVGENRTRDSEMKESSYKTENTFTPYEKHFLEIEAQDRYTEENYGLHRFHIIPDGNCLYRAVAQAVLLDQSQHELLRQRTVEYIADNVEDFKDLIEGDIESFLATAGVEGVWAGYTEVLALTRWLNININITTGGDPANPKVCTACNYYHQTTGAQKHNDELYREDVSKRQTVWLSWLSSGHYDMLSFPGMDNPSYDEWIRSRESKVQSDEEYARKISKSEALKSVNQRRHLYETVEGYDRMNYRHNHSIDDVSTDALSDSFSHETSTITSQKTIEESTKHDEEIARAIAEEMSYAEDDFYYA